MNSKNIQEYVANKVCEYLKERDSEILFYKKATQKVQKHIKYINDDLYIFFL